MTQSKTVITDAQCSKHTEGHSFLQDTWCWRCHPKKPPKPQVFFFFGHQLVAWPLRQGVCSQTVDEPEHWRPHNGTAEQGCRRHNWKHTGLMLYTVDLMAFVFFEVLYNDGRMSALRLQFAKPIGGDRVTTVLQIFFFFPWSIALFPINKQPVHTMFCFFIIICVFYICYYILSQRGIKIILTVLDWNNICTEMGNSEPTPSFYHTWQAIRSCFYYHAYVVRKSVWFVFVYHPLSFMALCFVPGSLTWTLSIYIAVLSCWK